MGMKRPLPMFARASSLLVLFSCSMALAQTAQRGQVEVRGITGYSSFLDESSQHHFVAGGSTQVYLTRRLSVGPEVLFMYHNEFDKDLTVSANVAWDFLGRSRVQPYVAGHVGTLWNYGGFPGLRFTTNSPEFGIGLGVKIALTRRLYLVPDFRMGTEPFVRATVGISYAFGRRE
jgi:hypothetical protein